MQNNNPKKARNLLDDSLKKYKTIDAHYLRGHVYLQLNKENDALKDFEEVAQMGHFDVGLASESAYRAGQIWFDKRKYDKAIEHGLYVLKVGENLQSADIQRLSLVNFHKERKKPFIL